MPGIGDFLSGLNGVVSDVNDFASNVSGIVNTFSGGGASAPSGGTGINPLSFAGSVPAPPSNPLGLGPFGPFFPPGFPAPPLPPVGTGGGGSSPGTVVGVTSSGSNVPVLVGAGLVLWMIKGG
jgi:hypothetical protein